MNQSLDESMNERQAGSRGGYRGRGQRGPRDRRQNNYPRDGVKKVSPPPPPCPSCDTSKIIPQRLSTVVFPSPPTE